MRRLLDEIYKECDYITIHVPALEDTKGMINKRCHGSDERWRCDPELCKRCPGRSVKDIVEALESVEKYGSLCHRLSDTGDHRSADGCNRDSTSWSFY